MKGVQSQIARVGDLAGEGRGHSRFRGYQIDLGIGGTAAPLKIAVEGPQAHAAGVGGEVHADAGAAGTFQQPHAGGQNIRQRTAVGQHGQYLPGAGGDGHTDGGGNGFSFQHGGGLEHIVQRGIGAGADADLIHLGALQAADGNNIVRHVGTGNQRLQRIKVNGNDPVIIRVRIGGKGGKIGFPALCL